MSEHQSETSISDCVITFINRVEVNGKKLQDFKNHVQNGGYKAEIQALATKVADFMRSFPTVGFEEGTMVYKD
ncbi:unnamed protein product [Aphanomyces euteiches]